ncbi:MAG TPA: M48 family metalloprotease, partial [Pirellulales bacterium]|nr:M48 family metalloprotease [Pirellulales bacterium]
RWSARRACCALTPRRARPTNILQRPVGVGPFQGAGPGGTINGSVTLPRFMEVMGQPSSSPSLTPLAYQRAVVEYLKAEDPAVWRWFAERKDDREQLAAARLELLKSTYRIERQTQPDLYALADEVAATLELEPPLTLYQAQHPHGLNACMVDLPGEIHMVLSGPVTTALATVELKAVFGHELAHRVLWEKWGGDYRMAGHMLVALANDPAAPPVYASTWRLFSLYAELFCDRAAWLVTHDLAATVSTLVKVSTELAEVSAESYLRQADEIFSQENVKTEGLSHPETYIRARALKLWVEQGDEATPAITAMLEGPLSLDELDLLGQKRLAALTRRLLDQLLSPGWFQSERVLAHARSFFEDYAPPAPGSADDALPGDLATQDKTLHDYYCYLLLDFATVDRDLEELPLAAALLVSRRLALAERFKEIVLKELKLTKKRLSQLDGRVEELLADAEEKQLPHSSTAST